jgi:hypothetical protein
MPQFHFRVLRGTPDDPITVDVIEKERAKAEGSCADLGVAGRNLARGFFEPVLTVERPMRMPLRYTCITCSGTMSSTLGESRGRRREIRVAPADESGVCGKSL